MADNFLTKSKFKPSLTSRGKGIEQGPYSQKWEGRKCVERRDKSENKGLISVDRSNEATLLLTIPRSAQVVYKGFSPPNICTYDARHSENGTSTAP